MRWIEFLTTPTGEPIWRETLPQENSPAIFPITKAIRPRLILVARYPDGSDVLLTVSHHTVERAFRSHMRYRYPDGSRVAPRPPRGWIAVDNEAALQERLDNIVEEFEAVAHAIGADVMRIDIPAGATDDELLTIIRESDLFDVYEIDRKR